jgi:hypothetical protein
VPRPGGRRPALVGAVAAIVVLAAVLAGLLATRDDGEPAAAGEDTPPAETGDETTGDDPTSRGDAGGEENDADGEDPLGGLGGPGDPDGDGGGTGGVDPRVPAPLPGDDWNDEARTQFVADCSAADMAVQAAALGSDPAALCGCVYDDMSTRTDFATFSTEWASDEFDPSSEFGQALTSATLDCALAGGA